MRYPIITAADAERFLLALRADLPMEVEPFIQTRGSGEELDQSFLDELRDEVDGLRVKMPEGIKSKTDPAANVFEAEAARLVHSAIPAHPEMLADPDFWVWLAVVHFPEVVEWRYRFKNRKVDTFTKLGNYGVGSRSDNLIYRLWLRAELVLDAKAKDRYHLADCGQIDFYRSHLFRQGYANARHFSRALLRYQYPNKDPAKARLSTAQIRELVKRLRRVRSNLFVEILAEDECRAVIEAEAVAVMAF